MEITIDKYVEELNKCMQMHPDYIEGHHVKMTYLKRDVKLYDAEDNKIEASLSKAYLDCKVQMELKYKSAFKKQ
ncbi:MAG: hypothetical protein OEQ24_12410 [Gammaproteobacteria bacterium]|nr:hypothetical protein [Gammaproteobacteria bacterium]